MEFTIAACNRFADDVPLSALNNGFSMAIESFKYQQHSDSSQTQSTSASHALLADSENSVLPKLGRELEMAAMVPVGAITDGIARVTEHPLQFGGEVLGAAALAFALHGPSWLRAPAGALALMGGIDFGVHAVKAVCDTAPSFADAWRSNQNLSEDLGSVRTNLGPLAFDAALMGLVGKGSDKLALRFQNATPTDFSFAFKNRGEHYSNVFANTVGLQNEFAYAGVGRPPLEARQADIFDGTGPKKIEPLHMAADRSLGNDGGSHYRKSIRSDGANVHDFVVDPRVEKPVGHRDKTISTFGPNGRFSVTFPDGESRFIELQRPIKQVNILEKTNGDKEYRFNGNTGQPDVDTEIKRHFVRAVRPNRDVISSWDNDPTSGTTMNHSDGLTSQFDYDGTVTFKLRGQSRTFKTEGKIASITSIKHPNGDRTFMFEDETGKAHTNPLPVPRAPEPRAIKAPPKVVPEAKVEPSTPPPLPRPRPPGRPVDKTPQPDIMHVSDDENGVEVSLDVSKLPKQHGIHRALVEHIVGADPDLGASNGMRSPKDVALFAQGHDPLVHDFLNNLGTGRGADHSD